MNTCSNMMCDVAEPQLPSPTHTSPHPHVPHVDLHDQGQPEKVGGQSNAAQEGQ